MKGEKSSLRQTQIILYSLAACELGRQHYLMFLKRGQYILTRDENFQCSLKETSTNINDCSKP